MIDHEHIPLVTTIREQCRVCYTCVRECPSKAIRIADGQAEVLPERCIGCGNCVRVCSQHAKEVRAAIEPVRALLAGRDPVVAMVAPSFPAEFADMDSRRLVSMLRAMGFAHVSEVAFGADLVADRYRRLLQRDAVGGQPASEARRPDAGAKRFIATTCPAIVGYVERYYPDLVDSLAPIVSPMVASARVARRLWGSHVRVVFIGPCIAKKGEADSTLLEGEVDAALTYAELRQMFATQNLKADQVKPSDFDGPAGGLGALFAVSRGMLQAAAIDEDVLAGEVVAADGRTSFVQAIQEFEAGTLDARLLEVLCCNGCIMGAGISVDTPLFGRRSRVSQYVRGRMDKLDRTAWQANVHRFADLDLSRRYAPNDQRIGVPFEEELRQILQRMGKQTSADELNCGACGYDTCREHAVAIFKGLAESEMCLPYMIEQLRRAISELNISNEALASAQEALMQSEKLASMGQLAAGIAHEVNNPLGVVLVYAHLLLEECEKDSKLHGDLALIAEQADRCKKIVSGLLNFARQNKVVLQATDVRGLAEGVLRTIRAPRGVESRVEAGPDTHAEIDRDQITQVLTNLVSNAFAAMPDGGRLTVNIGGDAQMIHISVTDTGIGIPQENLGKIFEPFFTTKQIGKGTGLGLAVTYGIVKMHRGDIVVRSNANPDSGPTGSTFTVTLPRRGRQE